MNIDEASSKIDAIIVFGGGIRPDGSLKENSRVRVRKAVQLWQAGLAPVIVMSGAWSSTLVERPARTEASAMAEYAEQLGCPSDRLFREETSKETTGNAYFVKTLFAIPRKWRRLIVVVADYHVPRTRHVCQRVFGPEYDVTVEGAPLPMTVDERKECDLRERAIQSLFDDWADVEPGDHQAIWRILSSLHHSYSQHPKYSREDIARLIVGRVAKLRSEGA